METTFEIAPSEVNAEVTRLKVQGTIDVYSTPEFKSCLQKLIDNQQTRILIDLTEMDYISSVGVGAIVGCLKRVRNQPGGDIKLLHVSPKVLNVFKGIGLTDIVDFLDAETEVAEWRPLELKAAQTAVSHFKIFLKKEKKFVAGREHEIRVEARDRDEQPVQDYEGEPHFAVDEGLVFPHVLKDFQSGVWEGKIAITDSGYRTLSIGDGEVDKRFSLHVYEDERLAKFPCLVNCHSCRSQAHVKGMNIYRCQHCGEIFFVDAWAHVITLKKGSPESPPPTRFRDVEIKINSDVNHIGAIRQFITSICEQEKFPETFVNDVVLAVEEALLNIIEHGYDFDTHQVMSVKIRFFKKYLAIRIQDRGAPYDITRRKVRSIRAAIQRSEERGVGGILINSLMDNVQYVSRKGANQLVMVKKYPAPTA